MRPDAAHVAAVVGANLPQAAADALHCLIGAAAPEAV
jgi:hypothetical protein